MVIVGRNPEDFFAIMQFFFIHLGVILVEPFYIGIVVTDFDGVHSLVLAIGFVSFFGPFFGDYRIMMLDADYQYALVGGNNDKFLWILSRTPQLDEATKTLILAEADRRGYDTSKLIWVKQSAK